MYALSTFDENVHDIIVYVFPFFFLFLIAVFQSMFILG